MELLRKRKKISKYIIDDIFQIIPTQSLFTIEPLLEKVMKERGLFTSRDIWFVSGVDTIEQTLLSYNLVKQQTKDSFILTDRGIIAKELGGFTKFIKHRQQELNALSHQRLINFGLLAIGLLGIISPFVSEWYKHKYFKDEPLKQPVHVVVDTSFVIFHSDQADKTKDTNRQPRKSIKEPHPK